MRALLSSFLVVAFAGPAIAASFDCKKARAIEETMICADPILSKLDEDVAAAYSDALKSAWGGALASYIRDDQRGFLGQRKVLPRDVDGGGDWGGCNEGPEARQCLRDIHQHRLGVLTSGGYRLSGVYERGDAFIRVTPWADGLDLAFTTGPISGYAPEGHHVAAPLGATTVKFPIEDDMTCILTVTFSADAAVVKQDGQCVGADLNGRWTRNLSRQPSLELF